MKKSILTLLLILSSCFLFGQIVFQRTYNENSLAYGAQATNDGGYIITGSIVVTTAMGNDGYLLKTDSAGNVQWMKSYGGSHNDEFASVQQTADGGYIAIGFFTTGNGGYSGKIYLVKTGSNGDTIWTRKYGSSSATYVGAFVSETSDNGFILSAIYDDGLNIHSDLMRTDSVGNLLWTKAGYGYYINTVLQTPDGGFVTVTYYPGSAGSFVKTDSNGNIIWSKQFSENNYGNDLSTLAETNDGGYILAGDYNYTGTGSFGGCYLVKTDSLGDTLWTKGYRCFRGAFTNSVEQTSDGGYLLGGYILDSINTIFPFALKTDSAGNVAWMRKFGTDRGRVYNVHQVSDGGFLITATVWNALCSCPHIYLIKTDSAGNSGCNDSLLNPTVFVPHPAIGPINPIGNETLIAGHPPTIVDSIVSQQTIICSSFVGMEKNSFNDVDAVNIYPNPYTSNITTNIQKQNIKQATFTIKNILGQTVFTFSKVPNFGKGYCTLALSFLTKGIYLLEINLDGERVVKKIVKE